MERGLTLSVQNRCNFATLLRWRKQFEYSLSACRRILMKYAPTTLRSGLSALGSGGRNFYLITYSDTYIFLCSYTVPLKLGGGDIHQVIYAWTEFEFLNTFQRESRGTYMRRVP